MAKSFFQQKSLVLALAVSMLLAAADAPLWVGLFSGLIFLWKLVAEKNYVPKISRRWTAFLAVLLLIQVGVQYRTLFSQEASSTFLLGLCSLKIMDYENRRDHHFLVLLGFIMVSLKPIFSLDVYWLVPSFFSFIAFWISMLPTEFPRKGLFLARMGVISIPLAALLFFAFPRVLVPWAQSRVEPKTNMGFSDQLNPGRVAELASTDAVAFRAKFQNRNPRAHELYWKGSVLTVSEGLRWLPTKLKTAPAPKILNPEKVQRYEIVSEPSAKNYLFTLETPVEINSDSAKAFPHRFGIFRNLIRPENSFSYQVVSDPSLIDEDASDPLFLKVPSLGEKTMAWVNDVKKTYSSPNERLKVLNDFFADTRFRYTLKPGAYDKEGLDSFLFERRTGFCEHFAGAYASLARALGIPSRILLGYQGGAYNPVGDFWRISQKDAHAWTEIFSDGSWRRMDPTDWVAPLRLTLGAGAYFDLSEEQQTLFGRSPQWNPDRKSYQLWWDQVTYAFETLNYRWMGFLLDFDRDSQKDFWREVSQNLSWLFAGLAALGLIYFFGFRNLLRTKNKLSEIETLIFEICAWAEKQGNPRFSSEPPLSFLTRLGNLFPEREAVLRSIGAAYEELVYRDGTAEVQGLKKKWQEGK